MTPMANAVAFFGVITALVGIVVLLDWWGRRKDARRQHSRP